MAGDRHVIKQQTKTKNRNKVRFDLVFEIISMTRTGVFLAN